MPAAKRRDGGSGGGVMNGSSPESSPENSPERRGELGPWFDGSDDDQQVPQAQDQEENQSDIAKELVVHGLLKELADRDVDREERRIALALEAVDANGFKTRRFQSPNLFTSAALAVCLMLAVGLGIWLANRSENTESNGDTLVENDDVQQTYFASVVQVVDAYFQEGLGLQAGDRLGAQTIQLDSGFVRLTFEDGVEVTLQGPAEYELVAAGQTNLKSGLLTATVPSGAEGFTVDTPDAEVVDLGTSFGIDLRENGISHVSVFEGEVEVSAVDSEDKRLLREGEAVEIELGEDIQSIDFDPERFSKVWPVSSGIERSTEAFRFIPPWPRQVKQIRSDTAIFVMPEGRPSTLLTPLSVNATEPGEYATEESLNVKEIEAGRKIQSFLLLCHPERSGPLVIKPVSGSITFDAPVLGLIIGHEEIQASARRFLRRGPRLIQPDQQLELNDQADSDVITLSPDRRTLTLDLKVRTRFGEMVRVIVDSPNTQTRRAN
ncbi:MAG: FecR family protein [Planctomycetota bacterium]